ncbi:hypothetical protein [Streptomyces sp. NPDC006739]|uniref:hypothetical protein n=1 Tax=Streptomyces sp. NPDC006739 TaxID=3364763 RepID=UPI0036AE3DD6
MTEHPEITDAHVALVEQAYRVTRADVAAGWERIRHDADAIAEQLTETLLPPDMRAAGMRFAWAEER